MTVPQLKAALIIAKADVKIDEHVHSLIPFDGFGLSDFKPVEVTIEQVARLIRYQAAYMNGDWDEQAIEEIKFFGKKRFIITESE